MSRRDHAPRPGRVVGLARDSEGRLLSGAIRVDAYEEFGESQSQWTVADASGSFVLDGVPPGFWCFRYYGCRSDKVVEARLPEDGEVRIEINPRAEDVPAQVQRAPTREVVVTGLPREEGAFLRAESGGSFWRVEAKDGGARFAALALGKWTLVWVRPGEPVRRSALDVVAGRGELRAAFGK